MKRQHLAGILFVVLVSILLSFLSATEGFVDAGRCGVGLPPCSRGLRCMNGYCRSDKVPNPPASDLPVVPSLPFPAEMK